jgi:hypothetical protein
MGIVFTFVGLLWSEPQDLQSGAERTFQLKHTTVPVTVSFGHRLMLKAVGQFFAAFFVDGEKYCGKGAGGHTSQFARRLALPIRLRRRSDALHFVGSLEQSGSGDYAKRTAVP